MKNRKEVTVKDLEVGKFYTTSRNILGTYVDTIEDPDCGTVPRFTAPEGDDTFLLDADGLVGLPAEVLEDNLFEIL